MSVGKHNSLSKLSALFPHLIMPLGEHENMRDYIDKVVRELPKPTAYEINDTLYNMKSIVDSQELQIQRNMMEQDESQRDVMHAEEHHTHEQLIKISFTIKQQEIKTQDMWWSEHQDSENKDYLHFLN